MLQTSAGPNRSPGLTRLDNHSITKSSITVDSLAYDNIIDCLITELEIFLDAHVILDLEGNNRRRKQEGTNECAPCCEENCVVRLVQAI